MDGDGFYDLSDAFPEDSSEFSDADGDGVGDNSDDYPDDPDRTVNIPPCPQNSSGFPECSCDVGYSGNLVFDEVNGEQWEGVCEEDISPSNEEEQTPSDENNEDEQTDLNNTTPLDEENEVPGFGFLTVSISLLAISFFRRRE